IAGPVGYAQDGTVIHLPSGTTVVNGVNFGFNFDVICNTNASGYGSLSQFLLNASALPNAGLAQEGFAPGTEHAIWMLPNRTDAPGLRASLNTFAGGVATIAPPGPLPVIDQPLLLDARLQPGYASRPIVAIDGAAAGATDGLSLGA